jgi:hypothetical protein
MRGFLYKSWFLSAREKSGTWEPSKSRTSLLLNDQMTTVQSKHHVSYITRQFYLHDLQFWNHPLKEIFIYEMFLIWSGSSGMHYKAILK